MFFIKVQYWGHSHVIALPKLLRNMTGIRKGDWLFAQVGESGDITIKKTITTSKGMIVINKKGKTKDETE